MEEITVNRSNLQKRINKHKLLPP